MGFSPEGTLLVTDWDKPSGARNQLSGQQVYSLIRAYRQRIPGSICRLTMMTIDPEGRVYLLDPARGQVLRFDRTGRYLDQTESIGVSKIHAGRTGRDIYSTRKLKSYHGITAPGSRRRWEVLSSTPLSNRNQSFVSFRMRGIGAAVL